MAKGYVIAQIDVKDPEAYSKYTAQTPGTVANFDGHFSVRGGQLSSLEGGEAGPRVVVIEFPSYARALEWYNSEEYQAIIGLRQANSTGSLFIVEGAD